MSASVSAATPTEWQPDVFEVVEVPNGKGGWILGTIWSRLLTDGRVVEISIIECISQKSGTYREWRKPTIPDPYIGMPILVRMRANIWTAGVVREVFLDDDLLTRFVAVHVYVSEPSEKTYKFNDLGIIWLPDLQSNPQLTGETISE